MEDTSQQEMFRKDLIAKGYGEATFGDEVLGALDHGADVISGIVGPLLNTGQTIVDRVTGVSFEESQRAAANREEKFDYIPRTKIGQAYSDTGKQMLEETLGPAIKSVVDYTEPAWSQIPEHDRMALSAATELGAIGFGAAASSAVKAGTKSAVKSVAPTLSKAADKVDQLIVKAGLLDADEIPSSSTTDQLRLDKGYEKVVPTDLNTLAPVVDEIGYTSGIEEEIIKIIKSRIGKAKAPKEIPANQLLAMLNGKGSGVRADEIEWTTYSDYLEGLGTNKVNLVDALDEARNRSITLDIIEARPAADGITPAKFGENDARWEYITPVGGTNYREYKFRFDNFNPERRVEMGEAKKLEDRLYKELQTIKGSLDRGAVQERLKELLDTDPEYQRLLKEQADSGDQPKPVGTYLSGSGSGSPDMRARRIELLKIVTNEQPRGKELADKVEELSTATNRVRKDTRELRGSQFRNEAHHGDQPNYVFFTRITDREIGGGKSFAIDELQSDWHQGKGEVTDRPYYKLPEAELKPYIQGQFDIAEKSRNSLYNEIHLLEGGEGDLRKSYSKWVNRKNPDNPNEYSVGFIIKELDDFWENYGSLELEVPDHLKLYKKEIADQLFDIESRHPLIMEKLDDVKEAYDIHHLGLRKLKEEKYDKFTKGLRPNAPLKNKEKWMSAAINGMLYKAVKEGYDSISWPNGQTNYVKYGGEALPKGHKEQLLKMYDVTLPKLIGKLTKKMDKNSEGIVFGKKSADSNPTPLHDDAIEWVADMNESSVDTDRVRADYADYRSGLVESYRRVALDATPEGESNFLSNNGLSIDDFYEMRTESMPNRYDFTPGQQFAEYINDMTEMDVPQSERLSFERFQEEIIRIKNPKEPQVYDEINSAYSHIKITPAMKEAILKGKPLFNKGGLVEAEMSSMGFAEGGLPKRTVPLGDSTNPSDSLGDVEFRADLDPAMSFNPLARLGYDPKKGKVMGTEEDIAYATNPYFDKYPDRELQDSMDKSVDKDNAVAKYFREGAKRSEVDASLLEDGYSQEQLDAKGIQGGDVVLSPAMAKGAGVWSHEYTHKGLEILSNRLGDDIESHLQFRKAYGEDAYDLLLALREDMGNDASEYISELFDTDTKGPYSKEESQSTDAYRSSDQLQNDLKYGGDSYENTEGSTGVKGLVRAAQDLLISEGEPDTSMRDEMKSLFN